jgi:hypothetical protein
VSLLFLYSTGVSELLHAGGLGVSVLQLSTTACSLQSGPMWVECMFQAQKQSEHPYVYSCLVQTSALSCAVVGTIVPTPRVPSFSAALECVWLNTVCTAADVLYADLNKNTWHQSRQVFTKRQKHHVGGSLGSCQNCCGSSARAAVIALEQTTSDCGTLRTVGAQNRLLLTKC